MPQPRRVGGFLLAAAMPLIGVVALPGAAAGASVSVPLACSAHAPGGAKSVALHPSVEVAAPGSVAAGQAFQEQIKLVPFPLPGDIQGYRLNYVKNLRVRYRIDGGASITGVRLAGSGGAPASVAQAGGIVTLEAPAQVAGGATLVLPDIVVDLVANGQAGGAVRTTLAGTGDDDPGLQMEVGVQAGSFNFGVDTHCWADPASPELGRVAIGAPVPLPAISVAGTQLARPAPGATAVMAFAVTLSGPPSTAVGLVYRTLDGTARAGTDYDLAQGVLRIPAGVTHAAVPVTIRGTAANRAAASFTLLLSSPSGATIANARATGRITPRAPALTTSQRFVRALFLDFRGRVASPAELADLGRQLDRRVTTPARMARAAARSPEWVGAVIAQAYWDALGRSADPAGLGAWQAQVQSGVSLNRVLVGLHASDEALRRAGHGQVGPWVAHLYGGLVGRVPDPAGLAYWTRRTETRGRADVVAAVLVAPEARAHRAGRLARQLLGRPAGAGDVRTYAAQLVAGDELDVAAAIGASPGYAAYADERFGS